MNKTVFDVSAESRGRVCTLRCRGEVDVASVGELSRRLAQRLGVVQVLDLMGLAWLVTGDAPPRAGLGTERAGP